MKKQLIFLSIFILSAAFSMAQTKGNDCSSANAISINPTHATNDDIVKNEEIWYVMTIDKDYVNVVADACSSFSANTLLDMYSDCSSSTPMYQGVSCSVTNTNETITIPGILPAGTYYFKIYGVVQQGTSHFEVTGDEYVPTHDLSIINIAKPVKNFNNAMPVTVSIYNHSTSNESNIQLSYILDENTPVTETYSGTIPAGDTLDYTFTHTMDLSTQKVHKLKVQVTLVNDENPDDNSDSILINTNTNENALNFNGNSYVKIDNSNLLNFTGDFTIEAYFKISSTTTDHYDIVSKHSNNGGTRTGYAIEYSNGVINALIGAGYWVSASTNIDTNKWYHVALVYNDNEKKTSEVNTLKLYINGKLKNEKSFDAQIVFNNKDLYIGGSEYYNNFFDGDIDEVKIFNSAHSQKQIRQDLKSNNISSDLVAYYNFNRGIADDDNTSIEYIPDMTNHNLNGKLHNFLLTGTSTNFVSSFYPEKEPPVITCVANQTKDLSQGENFYTVQGNEFDYTSASDNWAIDSVYNDFNNKNSLANAQFPVGTTTVNWIATDLAGNTSKCSFDVTVNGATAINDLSENNISIFPNPVKNILYISSKNVMISNIKITDLTGKIIYTDNSENYKSKIDVSAFPKGIYFISFQTKEKVFKSKFIKQ